ncbi:iron/zinc/copper transport system permease protein [Natronobacillus azotifigens]|uniref:Manganese transport system membrane protein MntC n=1 Tax=Natronobacillus azotifigens TaxID=472978 RepID=A0A9J6RGA1_9BACI|nr:metal ABC transporter permease [Natronobacillus azotifigens]MCZ0704436.1 metal ABC transporter permease [Natronobacillus azotifigens]
MGNFVFFFESLFQYQYLQNAMIAGILIGIICGVVGCFIILRGMALMGDAISHAVLPGVVLSYMFGISFFIGAVVTGVITALAIGYVSQNSKIKHDSSIGIMFTGAFALGIVLITLNRGTGVHLWDILFGNVLAVSRAHLWMTVGIGVVVLALIFIFYKQLVLSTFDPTMAQAIGLPIKWINYTFMLVLSLVTVASLQSVGIILVVAMLITPGSTAYLLTDRLPVMMVLSAAFGSVSAIIGVYYSFIYDVATGASIVLVASILFALVFLFAPKNGVVIRSIRSKLAD